MSTEGLSPETPKVGDKSIEARARGGIGYGELFAAIEAETGRRFTPKERAFALDYPTDQNATQTAIRVGYSAATAGPAGSEVLARPHVRLAVDTLLAQRAARIGMTQETVLHEMAALSHSSHDHYLVDPLTGQVTLAEGAPLNAMAAIRSVKRKMKVTREKETGNVVTEIEVELTLWDKPNALKLMGKHVGLFPDRTEHTGKDGGPIETRVTEVVRRVVDPQREPAA